MIMRSIVVCALVVFFQSFFANRIDGFNILPFPRFIAKIGGLNNNQKFLDHNEGTSSTSAKIGHTDGSKPATFGSLFHFEPSSDLQMALGVGGPRPPKSPPPSLETETLLTTTTATKKPTPYYLESDSDNDTETLSNYVSAISELIQAAKRDAQTDWTTVSSAQIKQECRTRGLSVGGIKAQLIARLQASDRERLAALAKAESAIADAEATITTSSSSRTGTKQQKEEETKAAAAWEVVNERKKMVQELLGPLLSPAVEKGVSVDAIKGAVVLGCALSTLLFKSIPIACAVGVGAAYVAISPGSVGLFSRKTGSMTWEAITSSFQFLQRMDASGDWKRRIRQTSVSSFAKLVEIAKEGRRIAMESESQPHVSSGETAQARLVDSTEQVNDEARLAEFAAQLEAISTAESEAELNRSRAAEELEATLSKTDETAGTLGAIEIEVQINETSAEVGAARLESSNERDHVQAGHTFHAVEEEHDGDLVDDRQTRSIPEEDAVHVKLSEFAVSEAVNVATERGVTRFENNERIDSVLTDQTANEGSEGYVRALIDDEPTQSVPKGETSRAKIGDVSGISFAEDRKAVRDTVNIAEEDEATQINAFGEEDEADRIQTEDDAIALAKLLVQTEDDAIALPNKSLDGSFADLNDSYEEDFTNVVVDADDTTEKFWSMSGETSVANTPFDDDDDDDVDDIDYENLALAARAAVEEFERRRNSEVDASMDKSQAEDFAPLPRPSVQDWNKSTVAKLRTELKSRGLRSSGKKSDLVAALEAADRSIGFNHHDTDVAESEAEIKSAARDAADFFNNHERYDDEPSDEALWEIEKSSREETIPYITMSVVQLKDELRIRGLSMTGKKADLIARLEASD